jgi:hypothetical protein
VNATKLNLPTSPVVTATPSRAGVLDRISRLRETTPGRLQLLLAALVALGLLTGAAIAVAASSTSTGTRDVGQRIEPLLVNAETIYSSLADADATAAQAFLAGGLEPPALTNRYNDDLRRANTALAEAAGRAPAGSKTASAVATLSADVSVYAGLVAEARANNRQGYPIGAAYLSQASNLNRTQMLPQAQAMFQSAQGELASGYAAARSTTSVMLMTLALAGLLVGLVLVQRYLRRLTQRTFNVALVAATALTAVLGLGVAGTVALQRHHLSVAQTSGSAPIDVLAQARILALQERGDEGLTLAARGGGGAYETDFVETGRRLGAPGGLLDKAASQVTGNQRTTVKAAADSHRSYLARHAAIRQLDDRGDYNAAVVQSTSAETASLFAGVTDRLGRVLDAKKATFTTEITAAGGGLTVMGLLGPALALIICVLAFVGMRARLEEYR